MTESAVHGWAILPDEDSPRQVHIHLADGLITRIDQHPSDVDPPTDRPVSTVIPGLIDIHTHGAAGVQFIDARPGDMQRLCKFYAAHGVTAFLATIGGSHQHIEAGIRAVRDHIASDTEPAALCLGIHLEGPFLNAAQPGAFRPETIVPPNVNLLNHYADLAGNALKMMTLAPEVEGAEAVIKAARIRNIRCAAGHSSADARQMKEGIEAGVTSVTHMFNAMTPMHHRNPGIQGIAMTDSRLIAEVIADGVHVDPISLRVLTLTKGVDGIALVTDSIGATGLPDGNYNFEEQEVFVNGGAARLTDGTLAGSTLTMENAVNNFSKYANIPWKHAVRAATQVPAKFMSLSDSKGHISPGMDADLVSINIDGTVDWTIVGGTMVYKRSK